MNASHPVARPSDRGTHSAGRHRRTLTWLGVSLPLAVLLSACGTSGAATPTANAGASSSSPAPTRGGNLGGGQRSFPGTTGLIAQASPGSLQVQSTNAQTTVTYTSATRFTQTVPAKVAAGQCVTITGSPVTGSTGTLAATSVRIQAKVNGACPTLAGRGLGGGFGGGFGGGQAGAGSGAPRPSGAPTGAPRIAAAVATGTVTAVTGSTVTMQGVLRVGRQAASAPTAPATITVTLSATTTVTATVATTSAAAVVGKCATAIGKPNARGDIAATSIAISTPGATGCRTGFGGGFGGGGGGGGAGGGGAGGPAAGTGTSA
jgi:hypothetical protein